MHNVKISELPEDVRVAIIEAAAQVVVAVIAKAPDGAPEVGIRNIDPAVEALMKAFSNYL